MIAEYKIPIVIEKIMSNEYNFLKIKFIKSKLLHFLMTPPEFFRICISNKDIYSTIFHVSGEELSLGKDR